MKNIYHEYSWILMKQKKWKKNCGKIKGVHFQNYSYLSSLVPNSAKPDFK